MTKHLTQEEVQILLENVIDKRDKLFIGIGIYAGRRVQEIAHIKWGWLRDPRGPKIWVKKQKKFMYFIKNSSLLALIDDCYEGQEDEEYVFTGRRGCVGNKPMSTTGINDMLKKYFSELGIVARQETSHCLRKTFARTFYDRNKKNKHGEDCSLIALKWLQDYFGHRALDVTYKYVGLHEEKMAEMVENVSYY